MLKLKQDNKRRLTKEYLAVKLTKEELLEAGREVAKDLQGLSAIGNKKAKAAAEFKSEEKKLEEKIAVLSNKISTNEEDRYVNCEWNYDLKKDTKTLKRLDTDEIVRVEDITSSDRQSNFEEVDE
ncbi:MAG TPA: hypothetical protein ENH85_08980 [Candidatus Scalindua sp.]|nr:hypothetical protein [Candidatus Scalindua sp.]